MEHELVDTPRLSRAGWLGLFFAMLFPTAAASLYFLALNGAGQANPMQRVAYSIAKTIQFTFPILFVFILERRWPRIERPPGAGMAFGLGFGLLVSGTMLLLYFMFLADSTLMGATPAMVRGKLVEFGVASLPAYVGLAGFVIVIHSLLEEYYWRWFVFARLCHGMKAVPAALLSSLAFMGHHVIVLNVYFPGHFLTATLPFSFGIAIGGLFWCWLFRRSGAIYAPWLSHLLIDATIFVIGWALVQRAGGLVG